MHRDRWRVARAVLLGLGVGTSALLGQARSRNIYGMVSDDKGSPLPGVTVTVS